MTSTAWYFVAPFLAVAAVCCAWLVVAGPRQRRLEVGPLLGLLASLGVLWVILPYLLPPELPPADAAGFVLHYDIRTRTTWIPPALITLLVLALAAGCVFGAVKFYQERDWMHVALLASVAALIISGGGYVAALYVRGAWELIRAAERGDYEVVEGPVADYELKQRSGGWQEAFTVAGVPFQYYPGAVNLGFDKPAPRGGPIQPGRYVRIAYRGNVIMRLETRE
jgi:hypothetical protein